jgi:hypothetical protein
VLWLARAGRDEAVGLDGTTARVPSTSVHEMVANTRAQLRRQRDSPQVKDAKRRQLQHVVSERPVERTRAGGKLPRPSHSE